MATQDLMTKKLDAEFHQAEAQLDVLTAQAKARKAKEDMDEISGLRTKREQAKQKLAAIKQFAAADVAATQRDAEHAVHELKAGIKRANERFAALDEAADRRFEARLDAADAKLRVWKAQSDQKHAEHAMQRRDALAKLEERIALSRARAAERRQAEHTQKAADEFEEAVRQFDKAYAAAATLYEK